MKKHLVWFRNDLRLEDNPALFNGARDAEVLPLYILDEKEGLGEASFAYLYESLQSLSRSLGGKLVFKKGNPEELIPALCKMHSIDRVFVNRGYTLYERTRDQKIEEALELEGKVLQLYNGSLLKEPWDAVKDDGTSYGVFSPFYKKGILGGKEPREPLPKPNLRLCEGIPSDTMDFFPTRPWATQVMSHWEVGEVAAREKLAQFLTLGLNGYKIGRDYPAKNNVSRLSPNLRFGEISPNTIWHAIRQLEQTEDTECFCKELAWREFSYNLLFHNPEIKTKNLQRKFDAFPWENNKQHFEAWKMGETGVPLVDAGMKELWETGYMHNRVRMVVASFLVKNLRIDWRWGEQYFWDCLVDADPANNTASWQWVAGCGADAAPYFRVFNPNLQQERFDPKSEYIDKYPTSVATPIVDLKSSRNEALKAFEVVKNQ